MATRAIAKLDLVIHPDRDVRQLASDGWGLWCDALFQLERSTDGTAIVTHWSFLDFEFILEAFERRPDGSILVDRRRLGRCGLA